MSLPAYDNFNRSAGSLGPNWSQSVGNALQITSNQCTGTAGDCSMYWSADTPNADQYAQIEIRNTNPGYYRGPLVRVSSSDFVFLDATGSTGWNIEWYNGGAWTRIGSTYNAAPAVGDIARIAVERSTFRGYINGILRISGTNSSAPSSGYGGVYVYFSSARVDNFEVGNLVTAYTISDNQSTYTRGKNTSSDNQPIYIRSRDTSSDNQPIYLRCLASISSNKSIFLASLDSITDTQAIFLSGQVILSANNNQNIYLRGQNIESDNQPLYIKGEDISFDSQNVYLRSYNVFSDNQSVYLTGFNFLTDTQNLYIKSSESITDNQPVYFQSTSDSYLSQSVFLRGIVVDFINNQSIYLKASDSAADFTSIYIKGRDTYTDNQSLYIRGLSEYSDSQSIYLISLSGHSDNQSVYLRSLSEYSNNQSVYLKGLSEYSDSQPVFVLAKSLTSNQKVYLKGSITLQDNQNIFIACSADAINNLSIYLESSGVGINFSDNQSVYIRSQDYLTDNQSVYIRSQSVSIDTQSLFLRSLELVLNYHEIYLRSFAIHVDNQSVYLTCQTVLTDNQPLYLKSQTTLTDNQSLYLKSAYIFTNTLPVYITGYDATADYLWIYLRSEATSENNLPVFIESQTTFTDNQGVYLRSFATHANNQPIYLAGQIIFTDNQPVYLTCQTAFTNSLAVFLKSSNISINNLSIYLRSSSTETNNQPVYLAGHIPFTKHQAVFLTGSEISIDWYIDETDGNDANDGKSPATPFKTIARLLTVFSEHQAVALKRGCMWRERLVIPNSCMVTSYGEGDRPILNALDVIPKASWSKTVGYTNVYQCLITPQWGGTKDWLNVYENESYLTRQTSIANVDANPGSMYPSAKTGTITLYIHTKNSDNPATNDKIYEYTHRLNGLDGYNAQNCVIRDIHTKGNLNEDGSLRVGPYSSVLNCKASLGSKHNVYIRRGTTVDGLETRDAYYNLVATSHVVCNDNSPSGETVVLKNISMYMTDIQWAMHGISCHRNVSGSYGTVYLKNITGQNMYSVISSTILHTGDITIENVTSIDTNFVIQTLPGGKNVYIDGVTAVGNTSRVLDIGAAIVTAKNFDVNLVCNNSLLIFSTDAGTLNLSNSVFRGISFTGANRIFYLVNSGLKITLNNNIYGSGFSTVYFIPTLPVSLVSNNNCFDTENSSFNLGGIPYYTVTAWKGTGQDAASVVGNCWATKTNLIQIYLEGKLVYEVPTIFGKFSTNTYIKGISKSSSNLKGQFDSIITISGKIQ